jgi:hypothetical protein
MDAALIASSAPAMVVLLSAICDLGAPALASEALDACYFDVGAIPYEVLWAALQAHALAGRSTEARQLLLSWLEAQPAGAPELTSAHEARVLRLVRLMRTRVLNPEDRLAASELAREVEPSLTLQSSRDQLWTETRREAESGAKEDPPAAGAALAPNGCTCATRCPDGGAPLTPGPSPCTPPNTTRTGADGTSSLDLLETVLSISEALHMAQLAALLHAIVRRLRRWWASLVPHGWWRLREAAHSATKTATRLSHRRANSRLLAGALALAVAALIARLLKRVRGRLAARRMHALVEQLGVLLGMLLGGDAHAMRAHL